MLSQPHFVLDVIRGAARSLADGMAPDTAEPYNSLRGGFEEPPLKPCDHCHTPPASTTLMPLPTPGVTAAAANGPVSARPPPGLQRPIGNDLRVRWP